MANKSKETKVKELCKIGDKIYINVNGKSVESEILDKDDDGIETETGFYFYEEHGRNFWFTPTGVKKRKI